MEFWGVEVKANVPLKVNPGDDMVLHLSQACLGETKKDKGSESVCLFVSVAGKKLVLGTLFTDKLPQQQFDLVFDRDFVLSHNWKSGSVYFYGYKASNPCEEEMHGVESGDSESEEDIPLTIANNGKPEPKGKKEKPAEIEKAKAAKGKEAVVGKQAVKNALPNKEDVESSDDSMSEDDDDDDDSEDEDDSDDSDDESGESDEEETPKKAETSKKRAADSSIKTPVQDKKAKVTPQRTDGKKVSGHVATPYPSKQGKTPGNKPQQATTPKSGGSHSCKDCKKTFGSEIALDSHSKAKHSANK